MSPTTQCAYTLILAALLFGCAVQVPGETKSDPTLKNTVTDTIKQLELAYRCSTLKLTVTDTKIAMPFDGTRSQEKWNILSCNGENHAYEVNFRPSPKGGTEVGIRKWPQ
ncbi:MAG: hypothetical protein AAB433_05325 [Nitrospirota bacterium]